MGRSVVFSAFYADFCFCSKLVIITTLTNLKNISNVTPLLQGQQLCLIILKSIHNCRSYGPDKSILMHQACTQARTNAGTYTIKNCNSYVSLNASSLYKKESSLKGKNLLHLEQIFYLMRWPHICEVTMKLTELLKVIRHFYLKERNNICLKIYSLVAI